MLELCLARCWCCGHSHRQCTVRHSCESHENLCHLHSVAVDRQQHPRVPSSYIYFHTFIWHWWCQQQQQQKTWKLFDLTTLIIQLYIIETFSLNSKIENVQNVQIAQHTNPMLITEEKKERTFNFDRHSHTRITHNAHHTSISIALICILFTAWKPPPHFRAGPSRNKQKKKKNILCTNSELNSTHTHTEWIPWIFH